MLCKVQLVGLSWKLFILLEVKQFNEHSTWNVSIWINQSNEKCEVFCLTVTVFTHLAENLGDFLMGLGLGVSQRSWICIGF